MWKLSGWLCTTQIPGLLEVTNLCKLVLAKECGTKGYHRTHGQGFKKGLESRAGKSSPSHVLPSLLPIVHLLHSSLYVPVDNLPCSTQNAAAPSSRVYIL